MALSLSDSVGDRWEASSPTLSPPWLSSHQKMSCAFLFHLLQKAKICIVSSTQVILSRYTLGFYNKRVLLTPGASLKSQMCFYGFSDLLPNFYGILPTPFSLFNLLKTILFTPVDKISYVELE
jgi:hypothetical protein